MIRLLSRTRRVITSPTTTATATATALTVRSLSSTTAANVKHVTKISSLSSSEISTILEGANRMKVEPLLYNKTLRNQTLLMLFEKPSLRTRLSFETGMTQMGGHAIFYSIADSPLGKKESFYDTSLVVSRYVDIIMARLKKKEHINLLAAHATVPVINALDDYAHPCQVLADFQTILERKRSLDGLKMAFVGDIQNNMTYDLMRGSCMMGIDMTVAGPNGENYEVEQSVLEECAELSKTGKGSATVCKTAAEAVSGVDVVYADTFQSYHLDPSQEKERQIDLQPFQVNKQLMAKAKPDAIFMHCLPAQRDVEVTSDVIDGPQSVVFDEAENRLHAQKALMLFLLGKL